MSNVPQDLRYASSHEWARQESDGTLTVGITDHAQQALGDVVFVELPALGAELKVSVQAGVVESVKAASDIYAPMSGTVVAVNQALIDHPEAINTDPYANWFFKIKPTNPAEWDQLLEAAAYQAAI